MGGDDDEQGQLEQVNRWGQGGGCIEVGGRGSVYIAQLIQSFRSAYGRHRILFLSERLLSLIYLFATKKASFIFSFFFFFSLIMAGEASQTHRHVSPWAHFGLDRIAWW